MIIAIDTGNITYFNPDKSHWLKSCPQCSRYAGHPVFKPYPDAFGESQARGDHHKGAQSWCLECRRERNIEE